MLYLCLLEIDVRGVDNKPKVTIIHAVLHSGRF